LEEGRISPALANAALDRHNVSGERFEEALLQCGLPESMLLRHLAEIFGTKFISTKTLASASVSRATLQRLSRRLAERYQVVPLRFAEDGTLTVAYSDPSSAVLLENVRVAAGARHVKGLVTRPAAIQAAIAKLYGGEVNAFGQLNREEPPLSRPAQPSDAVGGSTLSSFESDPLPELSVDTSAFDGPSPSRQIQMDLGGDLAGPMPQSWQPPSDLPPALDAGSAQFRGSALGDPSRLAECLMVIHERTRGSLKSHSVRVARLSYALCRQLDLSEPQAADAWAIGLFHDLGKTQQHHLTALNVW